MVRVSIAGNETVSLPTVISRSTRARTESLAYAYDAGSAREIEAGNVPTPVELGAVMPLMYWVAG